MTRSLLFDVSELLSSQESAFTLKLRLCAMIDSLDEEATHGGYTLNWPKVKIESEMEGTEERTLFGGRSLHEWNRISIHVDGVKEDEPA